MSTQVRDCSSLVAVLRVLIAGMALVLSSGLLADESLLARATELNKANKTQEAKALLEEFLQKYPSSPKAPEAQFALAGVALNSGDLGTAKALLQRLESRYPNYERRLIVRQMLTQLRGVKPTQLASSAQSSLTYQQAQKELRRAIELERTGDKEKAKALFDALVQTPHRNIVRAAGSRLDAMASRERVAQKRLLAQQGQAAKRLRLKDTSVALQLEELIADNAEVGSPSTLQWELMSDRDQLQPRGYKTDRSVRKEVMVRARRVEDVLAVHTQLSAMIRTDLKTRLSNVRVTEGMTLSAAYGVAVGSRELAGYQFSFSFENGWKVTTAGTNRLLEEVAQLSPGQMNTQRQTREAVIAWMNGETRNIERTLSEDQRSAKATAAQKAILSRKEEQALLSQLQTTSKEIHERWQTVKGASYRDSYVVRSEHAVFARDDLPAGLKRLLASARGRSASEPSGYSNWNTNIGGGARRLIQAGLDHWAIGFNVSRQSRAAGALQLGEGADEAFLHAPYAGLGAAYSELQRKWQTTATSRSSIASETEQATDRALVGSNSQKTRLNRTTKRFYTPTELFFSGLGQSAGQAVAGGLQVAGSIKQLEAEVISSRAAFFDCLRATCRQLDQTRRSFSAALARKDYFFFAGSGRSGSIIAATNRHGSIIAEGMTGAQGLTFIDGGIRGGCKRSFDAWLDAFNNAHVKEHGSGRGQLDSALSSLSDILSNPRKVQASGEQLLVAQRQAFGASNAQYKTYQKCRDQWEFDHAP